MIEIRGSIILPTIFHRSNSGRDDTIAAVGNRNETFFTGYTLIQAADKPTGKEGN